MAYSSPRTWTTGELVTAAMLNQDIRDNQNAAFPLGVAAWTTYTPSNTNITVGNGTQTASYTRVGRVIVFKYHLVWGSTTSYGGQIEVGLPVAAVGAISQVLGSALLVDAATRVYVATARLDTASGSQAIVGHTESGGAGSVDATNPFTWTTNDVLSVTGTYEAAS